MIAKKLYVDTDLLEKKISDSIVTIADLVNALGISRQAFDKKRKGIVAFRASEVYVLCDMLHINEEERIKIFYPKG